MNKENLFEFIKEQIGDRLKFEQIQEIVNKIKINDGEIPKIINVSNPYDFESNTRQLKKITESYEYLENSKKTDVLVGDYKPGKDDIYEYEDYYRQPDITREMSDFSIDQIQVALVNSDSKSDSIDEHSQSIYIYIPREREYPEDVSFKNMVLEDMSISLYNAIEEKVGKKLTEEQIHSIVDNFNFENNDLPKLEVSSDPFRFEIMSRQNRYRLEHSWAGETIDNQTTNVLIGDYQPGIDETYEYSDNGNMGTPEENHEMSDFSINQVQVALTQKEYSKHWTGEIGTEEYVETIHIYIPREMEYPEDVSFKNMVLKERATSLYNAIEEKVDKKLTAEQIHSIVDSLNFENKDLPELEISSDPFGFEKETRNKKHKLEHSWAGETVDNIKTNVLIGDYQPGIDETYEYSDNGNMGTPEENHEMSDFSINQVQVALTQKEYSSHWEREPYIDEYKETIKIYIPEEKEYPEDVSFKHIMEKKTKEKIIEEIKVQMEEKQELERQLEERNKKKDSQIIGD